MNKILFLLVLMLFSVSSLAKENEFAIEKAKVVEIIGRVPAKSDEENYEYKTRMIIQITSGDYSSKKVIMEHPKFKNTKDNINVLEKDNILVKIENIDGILYYTIISYNRIDGMIWITFILIVMGLAITRREGIKFFIAVIINSFFLFFALIPLIIRGVSPVLLSFIFSLILSVVTIILINGKTKKSKVAIFSTVLTLVFTMIFSLIYDSFLKLSGFSNFNVDSIFEMFKGINMGELFYAGVIIGFTGVVASISSTSASAMESLYKSKDKFYKNDFFNTGIAAGKELFFILINTIFIGFIGSALIMFVLLVIQKGDTNILTFVNSELFIEEFIRISIAGIGILFSIPVTAFIGEKLYNKSSQE